MHQDWPASCAMVKDAMRDLVMRFVTPISMSLEHGHGVSWATGNYLEVSGSRILLTNQHVVDDVPTGGVLAHLPGPTDDYVAVTQPWCRRSYPVDAACAPTLYPQSTGMKEAVPFELIDGQMLAEQDELLFWIGFPGYSANRHDVPTEGRLRMTRFGGPLETRGLPMLSQVIRGWNGEGEDLFNPDLHVAVHYPSEAQRTANGELTALPHAKGMSGSLLWDTKYLSRMRRSETWSPGDARVCGLVWGALDRPEVVLATKIEHVRTALGWP
ncbi:hypothetical protein SAMN04488509_101793 [Aquimonas voraii]|uniref:Trypsin-like peptidase domain-containing protein n=1 Tax=Aquimonas voraii TaxID=265719 RepID=A0A1G6SZQ1_9GAMM|nr:hypothetical protein SAMN04488509_101793 [Aquimonas voraii]